MYFFDIGSDDENEVEKWLDHLGLGRYYGLLHAEGFDDFRIIRDAEEEDITALIAMCDMPRLHAKQLRKAIANLHREQDLRKEGRTDDDRTPVAGSSQRDSVSSFEDSANIGMVMSRMDSISSLEDSSKTTCRDECVIQANENEKIEEKVFSYAEAGESLGEWMASLETETWKVSGEPKLLDHNGHDVSRDTETEPAEIKWPMTVKIKLVKAEEDGPEVASVADDASSDHCHDTPTCEGEQDEKTLNHTNLYHRVVETSGGRDSSGENSCHSSLDVTCAEASVWEVVGGMRTKGVLVRIGHDLKSEEASPSRLSCGAMVKQLSLVGTRLNFELISGEGPKEGWVTTTTLAGGNLLLQRGSDVEHESCAEVHADSDDRSSRDLSEASDLETSARDVPLGFQFHPRRLISPRAWLDAKHAERDFPELPVPIRVNMADRFSKNASNSAMTFRVSNVGRSIESKSPAFTVKGTTSMPRSIESKISTNPAAGMGGIPKWNGKGGSFGRAYPLHGVGKGKFGKGKFGSGP